MQPQDGGSDEVTIIVFAETEDSIKYEWRMQLQSGDALRKVAQEWGRVHSVPSEAVGLEDDGSTELDLDDTPATLGWKPGKGEICVHAFPLDEALMEKDAPVPQTLEVPAKKSTAPQGAGSVARACSRGEQAESSKRPALAGMEQPPAKRAKEAAGASTAAAAAPTQKKGRGAAARASPDSGALPEGDDPVTFQQANPKRAGTGSHDRYEKYKTARTPSEALVLGAWKGDIQNDFKKGFMKRTG